MMRRILLGILAGGMIAMPAMADDDDDHRRCKPVGTWLVSVNFPAMNLHFQQLLSLHRGGTLTETNKALHANAVPDPNAAPLPSPPAPPPFNGSDAHGSWKLLPGCRVRWSYLKMVFAGVDLPQQDGSVIPAGFPVGFLHVTTTANIDGDQYSTDLGATTTRLVFGPDPKSPLAPSETFPDSMAVGYRWNATD